MLSSIKPTCHRGQKVAETFSNKNILFGADSSLPHTPPPPKLSAILVQIFNDDITVYSPFYYFLIGYNEL
jgi:hypothetical protein